MLPPFTSVDDLVDNLISKIVNVIEVIIDEKCCLCGSPENRRPQGWTQLAENNILKKAKLDV